jgi:CheY-like chemotaxis protein
MKRPEEKSMSRLLIIDDNDDGQRYEIIDAAKSAGIYETEMALPASWEEAEQAIHEEAPIAVVDMNLWGGRSEGGIELIRRLHDSQPRCRIISLTAKRGDLGSRALDAGARLFIYMNRKVNPWKTELIEELKFYNAVASRPD